jgi:hypothetical protein
VTDQGSFFDIGDAAGDELAYITADGARVAEPSLFQQGRELTPSQLEADAGAAELLEAARARMAEHAEAELLELGP